MTTLTITGKGQVTLKQDVLRHLSVGPGEKVEIDKLPDGQIVVRSATQNGLITNFIGWLSRKAGTKLTIEEMKEIAAEGWAKRR